MNYKSATLARETAFSVCEGALRSMNKNAFFVDNTASTGGETKTIRVVSLSEAVMVTLHGPHVSRASQLELFTFVPDDLLFATLTERWHRERGATSSITQMAMCASYQRIIGMGEKALPFILRQMEKEGDEPDMWFWALRVITGADPVPNNARGDIVLMARAWLEWARGRYAW